MPWHVKEASVIDTTEHGADIDDFYEHNRMKEQNINDVTYTHSLKRRREIACPVPHNLGLSAAKPILLSLLMVNPPTFPVQGHARSTKYVYTGRLNRFRIRINLNRIRVNALIRIYPTHLRMWIEPGLKPD